MSFEDQFKRTDGVKSALSSQRAEGEPSLPHSGLGIASFVLGIFSAAALFLLMVVAGLVVMNNSDIVPEESMELIVIGFGIFALLVTALIGCGLGVAGLCQKNRKKIFAILGTVFSGLTGLLVLFFILAGAAGG